MLQLFIGPFKETEFFLSPCVVWVADFAEWDWCYFLLWLGMVLEYI